MRHDKFIQPIEGVEIVSSGIGARPKFQEDEILAAARRVTTGEPLEDVTLDLAIRTLAGEESENPERS